MNYDITLAGQAYTLTTSDDAQIAAIGACRQKYNDAMPQTIKQGEDDVANPDLLADDAAYLGYVFGHWAAANPGFAEADLHAAAANAFASYAGQNPPQQIIEQVELTGDALKAALRAYAADKRWRVETGGMTITGIRVPTDDRAKLLLLGAATCMADGSSSKLVISGVDYGTFTKEQFAAINAAVIGHVQGTFPILADLLAGIDSGTINTIGQINAASWS